MTALDAMFGAGTSTALLERMNSINAEFPGVSAVVFETGTSPIEVEVRWASGEAFVGFHRVSYLPTVAYSVGLVIEPGFRGKGALAWLCKTLNEWWPTIGIKRSLMLVEPGTNGDKTLRLMGHAPLVDGTFGVELPSQRIEEAVRYLQEKKEGKTPEEPQWRKGLPAPTKEPF